MTFSERIRPAAAFEDALIERLNETPGWRAFRFGKNLAKRART